MRTTSRKRPSKQRVRSTLLAISLATAGGASLAQGCGEANSLVGGACAVGYVACEGLCTDTTTDPDHCGGCVAATCAAGVSCIDSLCGGPRDGEADDSSAEGGPHRDGDGDSDSDSDSDGSHGTNGDGSDDGGGVRDACPPPPYVTPAACGACGVVCVAPLSTCVLDAFGRPGCAAPCAGTRVSCGGKCVDLVTDPRNCGACGKFCPSNICADSKCQGGTPGDIVVIGHDYRDAVASSSQVRVLANAIFIPNSNPLRILSYEQFADGAVVANVKSLLQASAAGRTLAFTVATNPAAIASGALAQVYDVVLIHDQSSGAIATLKAIGATWAVDVAKFAKAGGVVVALDGAGGQGGMPSLLTAAELLGLASHRTIVAGSLVSIVAPADRIATLAVSPYGSFDRSVAFQSVEPNGGNVVYVAKELVVGVPGDPVVIHKVVP